LHPDTHPDDAEATEQFKEVTAAYDVLGDPVKRGEYDQFRAGLAAAQGRPRDRSAWADREAYSGHDPGAWQVYDGTTTGGFDPDDLDGLLGGLFGSGGRSRPAPRRGEDLEAVLNLDFEDAVRGLTTQLGIDGPDGPRPVKVRVPSGVGDGQRIRLPGLGARGHNGGAPGDLYAVVRVAPHPVFGRRGRNLTVEAQISWPEAVLGTEMDVPTLDGTSVRVRVPAGTPHGRTLRVRGRGVRTARGTGDLLVTIGLRVPERVTDEQQRAVEAVAAAFAA
jgi:molecular chaperone DnaJ